MIHSQERYHEYCTLFGLKQLMKCPTHVTCNSCSSILDHSLDSFPNRLSQGGVTDVGISDHQLKYCARKTAGIKSYCHKQSTFRSLKNYLPEVYEEAQRKLSFPNYELFDDFEKAYENLILKVMAVMEKINEWDKLFKKFKNSCLHVDKDNYKKARNEVQKLIHAKKKVLTLKVN